MLIQENAIKLLESGAPIARSKTSERYQFVVMRSEGAENEKIATALNLSVEKVIDLEADLIEEFGEFLV